MRTSIVGLGIVLAAVGCGSSHPGTATDAGTGSDAATASDAPAATACTADSDCTGLHTVCLDGRAPRSCGCAAGYSPDASGACTWTGVIGNAGFSEPGSWSLTCATIDSTLTTSGITDPGLAAISDVTCPHLPRVDQRIEMPRRSRAEPLVLSLHYRQVGSFSSSFPAVGIGSDWHYHLGLQADANGWLSARQCLGIAEYAPESSTGRGAELPLSIMFELPYGIDGFHSAIDVDRIDIVPAAPGECPGPGTVLNGDAEGEGGWQFSLESNATGGLQDGAGAGGSRGIALHRSGCPTTSGSLQTYASSSVSLPLDAMASPALSFYSEVTAGAATDVAFLDAQESALGIQRLIGTGAPTLTHVCIPGYLRGSVRRIALSLFGGPTSCNVDVSDARFDSVEIVDDPSCGSDPPNVAAGFESTNPLAGAFNQYPDRTVASARVVQDAALAHSGTGVLALTLGACTTQTAAQAHAGWSVPVITPAASGTAGPAIAFFYRVPPGSNTEFHATSIGPAFAPVRDNQWHAATGCLDPALIGRDQFAGFSFSRNLLRTCSDPELVAYVDDVVLTTDPSCPAP